MNLPSYCSRMPLSLWHRLGTRPSLIAAGCAAPEGSLRAAGALSRAQAPCFQCGPLAISCKRLHSRNSHHGSSRLTEEDRGYQGKAHLMTHPHQVNQGQLAGLSLGLYLTFTEAQTSLSARQPRRRRWVGLSSDLNAFKGCVASRMGFKGDCHQHCLQPLFCLRSDETSTSHGLIDANKKDAG